MKKNNIFETIVKVGVVAATIGGALYLLKDKLEEDPKCQEAIQKAKSTIKQRMSGIKEEDAAEFFEEEVEEIIHSTDSDSERGYVKIKLPGEEEAIEESQNQETQD